MDGSNASHGSIAPTDWWKDFFAGLAVEFWRVAMPEEATLREVDFLWKHLRLAPGARVLDVPCGAGRLAIPLARRGVRVTGVDVSAEFLTAARDAATGAKAEATWIHADMRDLPAGAGFDAAFCFGNSFGYLDDAGNRAFLAALSATLRAGARFALDYGQTPESIFPRLVPRQEAEVGGIRFEEETRYDALAGRIENRFTISRGEKSETKLASQAVHTVRELIEMLRAAGLVTRAIFGSADEQPFALGAERLLLVAEKESG
ncbi:MAG TPA: methyltransferase domain-containing protein [Thermoanaerobaculia bacterium]|nr:methyltransferase domain-containing protein [Thermoanaerobaculia bacterium]